jgi:hypothetical protein
MGAARNLENPYERYGYVPKLTLAGRLAGTLNGRPVVIDADDSGVLVSFSALRTAWAARRTAYSLVPVLRLLKRNGIALRLRLAGLVTVDLLPTPSGVVRLIVPRLSRLV